MGSRSELFFDDWGSKKNPTPYSATVSFTYDALGRRTSMTDSTGITTYSYHALSRLTRVDGPQSNDTVSYAYDKLGNRIQMINQDGGITSYAYDSLNRLINLTDPQGRATIYSYDSTSNLTQMSYPNNAQANYTFDNLNRLISLTNQAGQDTISSHCYDYNPSGMRTKVTLANHDYILYSYDSLNRLTQEQRYNQNNELFYSFVYTYDPTGNRFTQEIDFKGKDFKIEGLPQKATFEYVYNQDNQLTQLKVYKIDEKDKSKLHKITRYTYDQNGNLIQEITLDEENQPEETKTLNYDYENRLIQLKITEPDENETETFDFGYDGLGRRISQVATEIEEGESETQTRFYLYDGLNAIIERDQTNQTLITYSRGLSYGGGIGGIISLNTIDEEDGEEQLYYHYDGLGSITALTDGSAKTVETYEYDSSGNLKDHSDKVKNRFTYTGREYDRETGLYYYRNRYYDPEIGRFITKDPLGMINGPNLYTYVSNNPINWVDPWGFNKEKNSLIIGFEAGGNISILLIGASAGSGYMFFGLKDPRSRFYYWQTPGQLYGIGAGLSVGITFAWGSGEYIGIANIINIPLGTISWSKNWKAITIAPGKAWGVTWGKVEYKEY